MSKKIKNFLFWLSKKTNYPLTPPQTLQLSLTYRCNLRCKMCSLSQLLPKSEELSTDQIFTIIDQAYTYGIKEILLTGGEPFLREDIFEISEYIAGKGLSTIITTNGVFLSSTLLTKITASKINHLHFSLDGLEETNDFFRGHGSFNQVIENIKKLHQNQKANFPLSYGIAVTVMNNNLLELFEMLKLAENLRVDVINFQPLLLDNSNFKNKKSSPFWPTPENLPVLKKEILKIKNYTSKKITLYEEPALELLLKYYNNSLTVKDWQCFGGLKTIFICFEKNKPLVYSCHGTCGDPTVITLKQSWTSPEALILRKHAQNCQNLCLQSCYSLKAAQNLKNVLKS